MSVQKARDLRKNRTYPEAILWSALRRRQVGDYHFRRQHPQGPYVLDFVCLKARLAIEIDGPSHDQTVARDEHRTAYLEERGFRLLRFTNEDVRQNLSGVVETIRMALHEGA